jgi:hypothetical protein
VILPTPAAAAAFLLKHWLPALLALALIVQTVRIEGFGIWPLRIVGLQEKYDVAIDKVREARAELKRISDARNEQAERSKDNIEQAERGNKEADDRARKIEEAPLPGQCATPREILESDL